VQINSALGSVDVIEVTVSTVEVHRNAAGANQAHRGFSMANLNYFIIPLFSAYMHIIKSSYVLL
jgi:hypothetical protein